MVKLAFMIRFLLINLQTEINNLKNNHLFELKCCSIIDLFCIQRIWLSNDVRFDHLWLSIQGWLNQIDSQAVCTFYTSPTSPLAHEIPSSFGLLCVKTPCWLARTSKVSKYRDAISVFFLYQHFIYSGLTNLPFKRLQRTNNFNNKENEN